jgi:hypothetical protein
MLVGGSAGQSDLYGVDIDEGILRADFSGRRWIVNVQPIGDARKADREASVQAGLKTRRDKQQKKNAQEADAMLEAIRNLASQAGDGIAPANQVAKAVGIGQKRMKTLARQLIAAGTVIEAQTKVPGGKGSMVDANGFKLAG